ncbi:hypothetical protein [Micromonospora craniellae]|uniref:Uncharacterized protein n=1 Tax=Micromonospora craniellae TaxID=2294034 RepID=A0A372G1S0_9ACTN|nr:hypothetical protein [Micromonospora craniellae]QOC89857.1 hypothetical protein ID554_16600 [Micromonospora craniellae]RFS47005.1 hypothetical protein D0Q02_07530 [Micromonospora craniellae]
MTEPSLDLTDAELRIAAARRPGYATYPQYRPGQPERLGRLPRVPLRPSVSVPRATAFQPQRDRRRPWWRRRWNWTVSASAGAVVTMGYCWTESGARRRGDRNARRAAR